MHACIKVKFFVHKEGGGGKQKVDCKSFKIFSISWQFVFVKYIFSWSPLFWVLGFSMIYTGEFTERVWEMTSQLFVCRGIDRECMYVYTYIVEQIAETTSPKLFSWIMKRFEEKIIFQKTKCSNLVYNFCLYLSFLTKSGTVWNIYDTLHSSSN